MFLSDQTYCLAPRGVQIYMSALDRPLRALALLSPLLGNTASRESLAGTGLEREKKIPSWS